MSGVRADPPVNAIEAGVALWLEANRKAGRSTNMTGYEYMIVGTILAAAAPVIAAQAARDERQAIIDLAEQHDAWVRKWNNDPDLPFSGFSDVPFADLLRGAETTGDE